MERLGKKAQIAVTDLIIATTIIAVVVASIMVSWNLYNNRLNERLAYNSMQIKAFQIIDFLIKSNGMPSGWENDVGNVIVPGLAQNDRNLSTAKVEAFTALGYDTIQDFFKIKSYDFYFEIEGGPSGVTKGNAPSNHKRAVVLEDLVIYEEQERTLRFTLWD